MEILMIGGTGTISFDATQYFLNVGHQVYLLNRGNRNVLNHVNLTYIKGDANDLHSLECALNGYNFDVIIDFVMFNLEQAKSRIPIYNGKCRQFIFISSATVYKPTTGIISEDSELGNNEWKYSKDKLECEEFLRREEFSFKYTIVRPYITYDARRLPFPVITKGKYYTLIDRIQKKKPVIICDNGTNEITLTSTKDFAIALEGLLLNPKAENEAFHITGDCVTNWNEILKIICKKLNIDAEVIYIPTNELARLYPSEAKELIFDKSCKHVFDNKKIRDAVPAFKTNISVEMGIAAAVDNLVNTEALHFIDNEWNAVIDVIIEKYERNNGGVVHKASSNSKKIYSKNQSKIRPILRKIARKFGIRK